MNNQLCVVLRPIESGGYISKYLPVISRMLDGAEDLTLINGECTIPLPRMYDEVRAQNLIDNLNDLRDDKGHPVFEAQISYHSRH